MTTRHAVTELLKSLKSRYQQVLDDAAEFYAEYDSLYGVYAKESKRIVEIEQQLQTIEAYKQEHGVYPQIKKQQSAEAYIDELKILKEKAIREFGVVEPQVLKGFAKRRKMLHDMAKTMARALLSERDASHFIGTMILRVPLPDDPNRCATNEKTKPIYIAALAVSLLSRLLREGMVDNDFIVSKIPVLVPSETAPDQKEYHPEMLDQYLDFVLVPIITAVLIHHIGSYSLQALKIYDGNRFRMLEEDTRKSLIKIIYDQSLNYLYYGLGQPDADTTIDGATLLMATEGFKLTEHIVKHYSKNQDPLANLLRIPMIYASFMMSTKPKHDHRIVYKAYDILQSGIDKNLVFQPYAEQFLAMVGKYPLGSGVFFISKESRFPERAVVTGLNPPDPESAIVKQLTRRQIRFDDHTQVIVSPEYLINNDFARAESDFGPSYYQKQFPEGFFWNPSEPWERDIDYNKFWRRDNSFKRN